MNAAAVNDAWWRRLWRRIVPAMTDFHALLDEQCQNMVAGLGALVAYMESGATEQAARVAECEHRGDRLKQRNLELLYRAFATPIDREDVYLAVVAIDEILNYAKSTVREMEGLRLPPDEHTLEIARLLLEGGEALAAGYAALRGEPLQAEQAAERARKTERASEKVYRRALAELFDAGHYLDSQTSAQRRDAASLEVLAAPAAADGALATGIAFVLEVLKRREVYRHMSNAADRVAHAGDVLHDIVIKIA